MFVRCDVQLRWARSLSPTAEAYNEALSACEEGQLCGIAGNVKRRRYSGPSSSAYFAIRTPGDESEDAAGACSGALDFPGPLGHGDARGSPPRLGRFDPACDKGQHCSRRRFGPACDKGQRAW